MKWFKKLFKKSPLECRLDALEDRIIIPDYVKEQLLKELYLPEQAKKDLGWPGYQ